MQQDQINPYRPPESLPALTVDPQVTSRTWTGVATAILVWLSAAAFVSFVVALLRSAGSDRIGGMLFCTNLAVIFVWLVAVTINSRRSFVCGYAASVVQIVICGAMLALAVGSPSIVIGINGLIALGFFVLAVLCQIFVGRPATEPGAD